MTIDLLGTKFLGFNLEWDYTKRICILSMPTYILTLLKKLSFIQRLSSTHSLLPFKSSSYAKIQYVTQKEKINCIQSKLPIFRKLLAYYFTMLTP